MAQRVASLYADVDVNTKDAESGLRRVKGGLQDTASATKQSGLRFTELASTLSVAQTALNAVAGAAQFAYSNISEGAELNAAAGRFENLAGTINTTADALLGKMQQATKGMVSDAELIAGASDIISLGLAKTEDDTVRLATAVSTLGLDMQQVILTFANNSKARLDSLGLSVEGVTQKAAELEAQGFKGDAFDEAVLIGLEEKMTLLGDASETTAGQLQMLEADWANLTNMAKQFAAELAGPVISAVTGDIQAQKQLTEAYQKGILTWGEWHELSVKSRREGGLNIETNKEYAAVLEALNEEMAKLGPRTNEQARAMEISAQFAAQAAINFAALTEHLRATAEGAGELSGAQAMLNSEMETGAPYVSTYSKEARGMGEDLAQAAEAAAPMTGVLASIRERLNALGTRHDFLLNLSVQGLEGLQQAIQNAAGFNANDAPDPYNVPAPVDPYAAPEDFGEGGGIPAPPGLGGGQGGAGGGRGGVGFASGTDGWMSVPPGFANDSYKIGLSSGEQFSVIPPGQSTGGGGININGPLIGAVYQQPGESTQAFAARTADTLAIALRSRGL